LGHVHAPDISRRTYQIALEKPLYARLSQGCFALLPKRVRNIKKSSVRGLGYLEGAGPPPRGPAGQQKKHKSALRRGRADCPDSALLEETACALSVPVLYYLKKDKQGGKSL